MAVSAVITPDDGRVVITTNPDGSVNIKSPYDQRYLSEMKSMIPAKYRKWNAPTKEWVIGYPKLSEIASVIKQVYGVKVQFIHGAQEVQEEVSTFALYYMGLPKERDGELVALGHTTQDLEGTLYLSLDVLKKWFGSDPKQDEHQKKAGKSNPYIVLGIPQPQWFAVTRRDIQKMYHKMARTYHPDINREPGAAKRFRQVKEAWDILEDEDKRKKMNAGITLVASTRGAIPKKKQRKIDPYVCDDDYGWMPPLRCGRVKVRGKKIMGRFVVSEILNWEDIENRFNQVLVTYWDKDMSCVKEDWINV